MVTHPSLNESNQTNKQTMKIRLHNVFELVVRPDGAEEVIEFQMHFKSCIERPKPSLKIRTANSIFWISLGIFRDYSLKNIFLGNKTFLCFKIESWNFQHVFEIEFFETYSGHCQYQKQKRFVYWLNFQWRFWGTNLQSFPTHDQEYKNCVCENMPCVSEVKTFMCPSAELTWVLTQG